METVLTVNNISKSFPGVIAVDDVSLELRQGEILALLGENGAGKSTLTQILGGALRPDSGQIFLDDQIVSFQSSADAIESGIAMVFQELSLVGSLSVAENIFANRQPVGIADFVQWRNLHQKTKKFLDRFQLNLDPKRLVKNLSMGQQQILEILKAISTNPRVLILDEPTSALTEGETKFLFNNIRKLQEEGMSFIYITHKLFEVFKIANRAVVMRNGKYVGTRDVKEVTEDDLVSMMVGRNITNLYGKGKVKTDKEAFFQVKELKRVGFFQNISFDLNRGEILGLAGLVGANRTEIGRSIFGIDPLDSGSIVLNGQEIKTHNPHQAIQHRIAYLTEDRKNLGLFLLMGISDNIIAPSLNEFTKRFGFMDRRKMAGYSMMQMKKYGIDAPSVNKKVVQLSGGNQQKCLVAMWMSINPDIIIFDEPTRGVDVGARSDIYHKLREFAADGAGIIIISSDMPELIGMCDRILVIHEGEISGEVERNQFNEELILTYAAGIKNSTARVRS